MVRLHVGGAVVLLATTACSNGSADASRSVDDVPESQRSALADGEVTVSELEAGFDRVVRCMEARGVDLIGSSLTVEAGVVRTEIGYDNGAANEAVEDDCKEEHFVDMYSAYAVANAPSPDEQRDFAQRVVACAEQEGVDVSRYSAGEAPSAIQTQHPDVYATCMSRLTPG